MSVNMSNITNKDAKMIYAKYWHKNMSMEMFPTIYIDKYWDYTINLFELNDDWNWFLERFNEEFKSAKEYIELLGTYSDHIAIEETIRIEFFSKIEEAINKYGGTITIYDTIDLQLARKRYIPIG